MPRLSFIRTFTGLLCLALTFALTVVPVFESRMAVVSTELVAHVESPEQSRDCPPVHHHWTCGVCRALRLKANTASPITLWPGESVAIVAWSDARDIGEAAPRRRPGGPRAPPAQLQG